MEGVNPEILNNREIAREKIMNNET